MKALWAAIVATAICAGVAGREWFYRHDHPHELGPSGEILALATAGVLFGIVLSVIAHERATAAERVGRELMEKFADTAADSWSSAPRSADEIRRLGERRDG